MRKLFFLLSAMGLLVGLSQCTKPEVQEIAGGGEAGQHVVLQASIDGNSKVAENTGNLVWELNDEITVWQGSQVGTLRCTDAEKGTFEGDPFSVSSGNLVFKYGSFSGSYTGQTGGFDAAIYLEGQSEYKSDGNYSVQMSMPYAVLKLDLSALITSGSATVEIRDKSTNALVASVSNVTTLSTAVYVAMPAAASRTYTFSGNSGETYDRTWKIDANTFYTKQGEPGAAIVVGPVFSVSSTTKVVFSRGNLQYRASTNTWRFAEHQWDMCDVTTGTHTTSDYAEDSDKWIDLFGWGTSGWNNKNHFYQPYDTDNSTYDWSVGYGYGPTNGSSYEFDLTGDYANSDWGYNTIYSGGTATTGWRTLTNAEWYYLLSTRTVTVNGAQEASYGEGSVNGVNGLIVLPDDWDGSVCPLFTYGDSEWSNTFSVSTSPKWSAMESAGAVFLPAAGYRDGASVDYVGSHGYYWSSSYYYSSCAIYLYFYSGCVYPQNFNTRLTGQSVRLVR